MKLKTLVHGLVMAGLAIPGIALATNGYFSHGYGMKAKGMGGAATATTSDTFGGANNPASMVWVGDRLDIGVDVFMPKRSASRQGSTGFGGAYDGTSESASNIFLVPEFGYNKLINPNLSFGVTVYGNGGMNTDYSPGLNGGAGAQAFAPSCQGAPANILFGCGRLGVDLMQLIIAPTASFKINANHSIGVSPLIGYQRFKVDGLQAYDETLGFAGGGTFTSSQGNVTNRGYDDAFGWGVRLGWMGKFSDTVTVGAAYSSKIRMGEFKKYKGLFAEGGDFDIPENYNIGVAVKVTPQATVALDIQQINYAGVKSIANGVSNSLLSMMTGAYPATPNRLGDSNGSGFKWRNQTVYKLGAEYEYSKNLTMRAGYNYGKSPVRGDTIDDVTFNILAPGVVEQHVTLGATWALSNKSDLTVSYMHAFSNSVTGPSVTALLGVGGTETLKMKQDALGIAYSIRY
ncbi:MAG: outer membrane protein transport protein [Betaproteobacteria bacterium]|nr:outer membrane protein transport protein [Betaproteobacteria bacterium]